MNNTCIVIVGPTAVGKTAAAIAIAKQFNTEIISADSRQCYEELNIGVARPSEEQLQQISHHFIATHSIADEVHAATFEQYALQCAEQIFAKKTVAVMVGGTGLYVNAFCQGLDEIPPIDPEVEQRINKNYAEYGIAWLQQQLHMQDALFAAKGEMQNPHRMLRALAVQLSTGKSIIAYQQRQPKQRNFNTIKIGLELPREILYTNINQRVDEMMARGLLQEAEALLPYKHLKALQTVGYQELFDFLDKKITLPQAVALIQQHSRNYAKRQLTWFKKDAAVAWYTPTEIAAIIRDIVTNPHFVQ